MPMEHSRSDNISTLFPPPPPPPPAVNFHEEQSQLPAVVSATGFSVSSAVISSILSEELAVQIKREKDEIEQLIYAQVASNSILLSDCLVPTHHQTDKNAIFFVCPCLLGQAATADVGA